jgi:hypothetical protein
MGKSANLTRVVDEDGGIGYQAGKGGAVTQATSKATAVTLNKPSGRITLNGAALAAGATAFFTLNNTIITPDDNVLVTLSGSMGTMINYNVWTYAGTGFAIIAIKNISGGSLSDAPTINFAVIKGANT